MTPWDPTENGRYWVVGGRYADMTFAVASASDAHGPFTTRYDAEACWRAMSFAHTHDPLVRYVILQDAADVARAA